MYTNKDTLHYGCVWEDADILCQALAPVAANRRLLSISSAGDNSLALLTLDPSEVAAVDVDLKQLAALDLRARAFEFLEYDQLLAFLGISDCSNRLEIYGRLRDSLTKQSRAFWDNKPQAVQRGIIHAGRFEQYMRIIRALFSHRITVALDHLSAADTTTRREQLYDSELDSVLWRSITGLAFSPITISIFDIYRRYLSRTAGSVVSHMRQRLRRTLVTMQWKKNPYLTYFFTGNFSSGALPLYLRRESYSLIRSRIGRLSLHNLDVTKIIRLGNFSGFNLSNLFQYLDPIVFDYTYNAILSAADRDARFVYWYTFASDIRPLPKGVRPLPFAKYLQYQDKVGTYESFHIDVVSDKENER